MEILSQVLPTIKDNPLLIGLVLFLVVFIPTLNYIIKRADESTKDLKETYDSVMAKGEARESRYHDLLNTTVSNMANTLTNIDSNMTKLNGNMDQMNNNLRDVCIRVEKLEDEVLEKK